ncbi:uncharacterized protein LOC110446369 [Mizuhopecten yessoensis]|uniref:Bardet-Biedl syndrome 12 protein-like n=1 Tax=Mizuhopecten yessoensis TaxID=6573 RepID=A0A210R688_MIZYE|nr:uncharacterized protein LOC110446369 [Mizuhopecten yessoensis]OWF56542.1 Bardet-Biedl syndrome 12 protein-like [Mizuhopecten yessoensis]
MSRFRKMTSGPEAAVCLASMFNSSLGVRHGLKCIVDGDKELFLRSASLVLQNLDIEHPVGQYLVNTCQSFHNSHGNGVKTLLFLIGALMKMAVSQREKAIPVCDIMSGMEEGVKQCQKVMEEVKLPLSDVIQSCDQCQCNIHSPGSEDQPTHGEDAVTKTEVGQDVDHCIRNMSVTDQSEVRQLPCDITHLPTKSDTSPVSAVHTVDMAQLTLKENKVDPGEDLDWFFEDDPFIQGFDIANNYKVQGLPKPDFLGNKTSDSVKREVVNQTHCHADDSDFDDCFDDIPKVHKFELTKSGSVDSRTTERPVCNISNKSFKNSFDVLEIRNVVPDLTQPSQNHTRQESTAGDVEDEFDSCFDVEYDNNEGTAGTPLNEGQQTIRGQQVRGQGVLGQYPPDRSKNSSDIQPETKNMEKKLQDILKGKTIAMGEKHRLLYNSSRHFKTVESTIDIHKQNELSTDQKGDSHCVTPPRNYDHLRLALTSQGQGLKCQSQRNVIQNQTGISQDKMNSLHSESEVSLNQPPSGDTQDKVNTKTLDTINTGSEALRRKLDILLEKAKSRKVSGAMLQSRHFREIGQSMNDNEQVQRLEVKDQRIKNDRTCSDNLILRNENDEASKAYQMLEVKSQELVVPAQPGQGSEVKSLDRTSVQNEEEIGMCTQMMSDSVAMANQGCDVDSKHGSINRRKVCTCTARQEIDRWAGLRVVARNASHSDEGMMDVLVEAAMSQSRTEGGQYINRASLTLDLLYCCVTLGPLAIPQLVSGVVMTAHVVNLPLVHRYKGRKLNTIMINGDIKPTYRHIGYKRPLDVQKTMTAKDFLQADKGSGWLSDVTEILHKFSVTCLLVRGSICDEVKVMCETFGVIAVENVPYKALQVMCTATVTSMTTYLSMTEKTNVCASVSMDTYTEKRMMGCQANFVKVTCHNTPVQTCVVSHPTTGGGDLMEQDFWRCANILSSLLSSGHVLPGGGRTEQLCSQALLSSSAAVTQDDAVTSNHHLQYVLQDMAAVLHDYNIIVNLNTGQGHSDPPQNQGQGYTELPPIKGQVHSDPPAIKSQGHSNLHPIKDPGYRDPPPPIKGHVDTEADRLTNVGQTVFKCNISQGQDHNGVLENMHRDDFGHSNQIKNVHHLKFPSNSDKQLPSDMDIQDTNTGLGRDQLSDYGEQPVLELRGNMSVIFDDYKSKKFSIKTACDFVGTVLMCDSYIVTGLDKTTTQDLHSNTTDFIARHLYDVIL